MESRSMPTGVAVLKWYFIIWGIITVLVGLILPWVIMGMVRMAVEATGEVGAQAFAGGIVFFWGFFAICWGILDVLIGVFLAKGAGWARIAAIIVGILSLLSFPIGTALGIICLVVLFGEEGKAYFMG
jgi:hypothetical protein